MLVDSLLEAAGADCASLVAAARNAGVTGPLLLGGSLVDGLGTRHSDLDLFAIGSCGGDLFTPFLSWTRHHWSGLQMDVHVIDGQHLAEAGRKLRDELLLPPGRPATRMPYDFLVALHALHSGQLLTADGHQELETLRTTAGADLLPLLLGLRALAMAEHHRRDAVQFSALGLTLSASSAARSAVESLADACIAVGGCANPNPKWRVPLLQRFAREDRLAWLPWRQFLELLFPRDGSRGADPASMVAFSELVDQLLVQRTVLGLYREPAAVLVHAGA
ncbi:hypothetical protein [Blastococcus sp. TF02-8]|uniref:hypothetical protein n=1 Tax=Blastococcus sp. TF02-8 TaxID=2250574 RepID=UPI001411B60D|nr:hypothetical protein [Blastococcus sp. TF02-8]